MTDNPVHPDQTHERILELENEQHPFAAIISCSDSRVPPEQIFDQGLGDLFVIRNAGNLVGKYELGSVEYAVEHLDTKLVIVLGHENCGAIKAYIDHKNDSLPNHIQDIIDYIKHEPEEEELEDTLDNYYLEAIKANVLHGIHVLEQSEPSLANRFQKKEISIIGAIYNIHSGEVEIINPER